MLEVGVVIRDRELFDALDKVQRLFTFPGQQAIFEEWARRVEQLIEIPCPAHTFAPLPRRYEWSDGQLHKFKSLRAQRGFFADLRAGRIKVPYQRTNQLKEALRFRLTVTNGRAALTLSLANRGGFRPEWVLGQEDEQSLYFRTRTNWRPLEQTLKAPPLYDDLQDAYRIAFQTIFEDLKL